MSSGQAGQVASPASPQQLERPEIQEPYNRFPADTLKETCRARRLRIGGPKPFLMARLRELDAKLKGPQGPQGAQGDQGDQDKENVDNQEGALENLVIKGLLEWGPLRTRRGPEGQHCQPDSKKQRTLENLEEQQEQHSAEEKMLAEKQGKIKVLKDVQGDQGNQGGDQGVQGAQDDQGPPGVALLRGEDLLEWPFSAEHRHDARLLCELVQSMSDNGKETVDMSFFSGEPTFMSCLEQVKEVVAAEGLGNFKWACDVIAVEDLAANFFIGPMLWSTFCISAGPRGALTTAAKFLAYRMMEEGIEFHKPKFELEEEWEATTWILLLEKRTARSKLEKFDPTDLGPADFEEFEKFLFPPESDDLSALGA